MSECSSQEEFLLNIRCGVRAGEKNIHKGAFPCGYKLYKHVSASIVDNRPVRISDGQGAGGSQLDQDQHLIPLNLSDGALLMPLNWWLPALCPGL